MAAALNTAGFATAVIDALSSHICVTDRDSVIVAVNRAWRRFGNKNEGASCTSGVGSHYLRICQTSSGPGADEADEFALGVQAVLEGRSELFQLEYPCHSPTESRWFLGRVTPLGTDQGGAVISHADISDRKRIELELAKLASTDPLTSLPNRRYFLDVASRELERVGRFGALASVVLFDFDHFKALNDTYGHAAGDNALRSIKSTCRLRDIDVLARWGGEEFVAILPGTDEAAAFIVAEKLRRAVSGTTIVVGSKHVTVTASFGVAQVSPHDKAIEEAIGRADDALYSAKRLGRNRVERSSEVSAREM